MDKIKKLLLGNKSWAQECLADDPDFFKRLADVQQPEFLWISCSDSRVSADTVTNTRPGEIFVHRNVANMVVPTDFNLLTVLEYAVHYLHVKHIVVCGHYGCGGVKAAMTKESYGLINAWLHNIKDVRAQHEQELLTLTDPQSRFDRLVELNVCAQTWNLARTWSVQSAWAKRQAPDLHGWVYDIRTGQLKPLLHLPAGSQVGDHYQFDAPQNLIPS
jgi:carbonic anhydrase